MKDQIQNLENLKNKYYSEIQKNLENNKKLEEMILRIEEQIKSFYSEKNQARVPNGSHGSI